MSEPLECGFETVGPPARRCALPLGHKGFHDDGYPLAMVRCSVCQARVLDKTLADAIEAWSRRTASVGADAADLAKQIEQLLCAQYTGMMASYRYKDGVNAGIAIDAIAQLIATVAPSSPSDAAEICAEICAEMAREMSTEEAEWISKGESDVARVCAGSARMLREAERRIRALRLIAEEV